MIVRGYIIPGREEERFIYSKVISQEEVRATFKAFDDIVKQVINDFTNKKVIYTAKDVNMFLDALILFLRSILYKDTIPGLVPSIISGIYPFFINHIEDEKLNYSPELYINELTRVTMNEERMACERRLRYLLDYPADDRPGANTSSLLIHTLTTAAIASAIYLDDEEKNRVRDRDFDLAILRLTCLFHDIGKLIDWKRHEDESSKYLLDLLSKYVRGEALDIADIASRLIKRREHEALLDYKKLGDIYVNADGKASEVDRLSRFLLKLLGPKEVELLLGRAEEYLGRKVSMEDFEKCYKEFEYWKGISLENRVKLTEEFCKRASIMSKENPLLELEKTFNKDGSEVKVVRYDIRGIQSYIRVNDLRSMAGASLLIDYTIFVGIPFTLMSRCQMPAESVLYFGGGNLTAILPNSKEEEISEKLRKEIRNILDLEIVKGSSQLVETFIKTNKEIDDKIVNEKLKGFYDLTKFPIKLNIFMKCEICGRNDASEEVEEKRICSVCKRKRETGDKYHFSYKLERLQYLVRSKYLKRMTEYISGTSRSEIEDEKRIERYKNLAILRFDANIAGLFMASSITITDAFERSVRIDSSLKEAYHKFLNILREISREDYDRLVLGTIYIGGDDGFIIGPSRISVPLALFMMNEFYLDMGGKISLSCGIAVAKPLHPLIPLYDAAGFILDEIVKENTRALAYVECAAKEVSEPSLKFRGALGFYTADGGFISKENLKTVLDELYNEGISGQRREPYILSTSSSENRKRSILTLLNILNVSRVGEVVTELTNLSENIRRDLEWLLKDKKSSENIKEIQRIINEVLRVDLYKDHSPKIQSIYIKRQAERMREELKEVRAMIADSLLYLLDLRDREIRLNVYDILLLTKVMLGE